MSEFAPPDVLGDVVRPAPQGLTSEAIDAILSRFRRWLEELPVSETAAAPAAPPPDLHSLLGQMIGLRQDVNLQTRAVRHQQEQNTATLEQLGRALDMVEQHQSAARQQQTSDAAEAIRPLLKILIDVYDALALALREVQKGLESLTTAVDQLAAISVPPEMGVTSAELAQLSEPPEDDHPPLLPWLARVSGSEKVVQAALQARRERERVWRQEQLEKLRNRELEQQQAQAIRRQEQEALLTQRREAAQLAQARIGQLLQALVTGYTMSMQRIDRALQQFGLEPLSCLGQSFDPEFMEVVEVVTEEGRSSSEVIEEVRRGYLLSGRVFRFAQVRVARPG